MSDLGIHSGSATYPARWGLLASLLCHAVFCLLLINLTFLVEEEERSEQIVLREVVQEPISFKPEVPLRFIDTQKKASLAGAKPEDLLGDLLVSNGNLLDGVGNGIGSMGLEEDGVHEVSFFGEEVEAESVVFVVDQSGSMKGLRFNRAQKELISSLRKLNQRQKFSIIFFNTHVHPYKLAGSKEPELVPAEFENIQRAERWIRDQVPGRETDPGPALEKALSLKPDIIFFLTDGDMDIAIAEQVRQWNQGGSEIHTVALATKLGEKLLRQIAEENRGRFRYVR